jgi:hypothetical protein
MLLFFLSYHHIFVSEFNDLVIKILLVSLTDDSFFNKLIKQQSHILKKIQIPNPKEEDKNPNVY